MTVPYTFGTATTSIPLSNLDANFNTPITLGNTSIYLGNTTTTIGNLTLTNATISSGTVNITNVSVTTANVTNITVTGTANIATGNVTTLTSTSITDSGLTSGRVTYAGTAGLLQDDADFTFNGTTVTMANDASISGLTVGKGNGAVSTNTAVGASALVANTSGDFATAVGSEAGFKNTTGRFLVAVGRQAGYNNLTGGSNTAVGESAFFTNSVGDNNTAIGQAALYTNTASQNTAVGSSALLLNSSGTANSALGYQALRSNTTASNNTAVGYQAGYTNIIGTNIVAFGQGALYTNNADDNTAVGRRAGFSNSSGTENAFFGTDAGYSTTGSGNSFFGSGSGNAVTSGTQNTIIGQYNGNQGGLDIRTASNHIVLSDGDGNPRGIFDSIGTFLVGTTSAGANQQGIVVTTPNTGGKLAGSFINASTASPYGVLVNYSASAPNNAGNECYIASDSSTTRFYVASNGGIGNYAANNVILSDSREKINFAPSKSYLDVICAIPVQTFNYIDQNFEEDSGLTLGVTAQDVQSVAPELVSEGNWGTKDKPKMRLQIYQTDLQYALMKCIQELKAEVDALKTQIGA